MGSSILALFIQLLIQHPQNETVYFIDRISIEQQIPKHETLKQIIYSFGNKVYLDEEIRKADKKSKIDTERIVRDLFLLAMKDGGEYSIILKLNNRWNDLLIYLRSINYSNFYELVQMLSDEIMLNNNEKLTRYSLEDSIHIISSYWEKDSSVVNKQWLEGVQIHLGKNGPGNPKPSLASKKLVEDRKIKSADAAKRLVYDSVMNIYFYLDPPWKKYDIPFGSIGWRMGS